MSELGHASVAWSDSVVNEQRFLPVVVVGLGQVPGVVRAQDPDVSSLFTVSGDDRALLVGASENVVAWGDDWSG